MAMIISVIGGGDSDIAPEALRMAEEVGRELARHGIAVVCGGLGGVMEAVCRGAKSGNGTTIGIMPGSDPAEANRWVDYPGCTGMGYARNSIVVKTGRAVIAIDGAYGTLSEIGHALGGGIPVVGLNTWALSRNGDGQDVSGSIVQASDPVDAAEKALAAAEARDGGTT